MIRHIVLFRLDARDDRTRAAHARTLTERIEGLAGVVPGLRRISVDPDIGEVPSHFDLALVAELDDRQALHGYQRHPAHVEVAEWIRTVAEVRAVVDAELAD